MLIDEKFFLIPCVHILHVPQTPTTPHMSGKRKMFAPTTNSTHIEQHNVRQPLTWLCRAKINIDTFRAQWQNQTKHTDHTKASVEDVRWKWMYEVLVLVNIYIFEWIELHISSGWLQCPELEWANVYSDVYRKLISVRIFSVFVHL